MLQREIVKEGLLLWAACDDERIAFETHALARYMDTAHLATSSGSISANGLRSTVPVRVEVVQRKLATIREAVEQLRAQGGITTERLARDIMPRWAIERGLHVAAEALFDSVNRILAGEFSDSADEYAQVAERLSAHGVITPETANRLRGLSGFRNILVHAFVADAEVG